MTSVSQPVEAKPTQVLTFFVAGEEYGIGILQVKEIIQYTTLTRVPTMPPSVRGVVNLRGNVVPVIDLAVRFGLPESAITKWTCVVIVEVKVDGETTTMGLLADTVSQVIDFRAEDVEPAPSFGTRVKVEFLLGLGKQQGKFVLLLDLPRLLSAQELLAATEAASAPPASAEPGPEPTAEPELSPS